MLGNDGFDVDLIYGKYYLKVILFVQNFDKIEYLKEHIEGMIPCNIILDLMVSESLKKSNLKTISINYSKDGLIKI